MYNNPYNPYLNNPYSSQNPMQYPHYEVIQVNGKPGVDEFKIAPNSSTIVQVSKNGTPLPYAQSTGTNIAFETLSRLIKIIVSVMFVLLR